MVLLIFSFVALLLQSSTFNSFQIWGIKPDLVLLIIVFNAFLRGHREGAFAGFCVGLLQDIITGSYIGLNALTYMAVGYLVGMTQSKLYKDSSLIMMFLMLAASLVEQFLKYLLMSYTGVLISPLVALIRVMIPTAIYTALLVPLLYKKFQHSNQNGWLSGRDV
ncbi:rod shape-determining protein MreD [Desulfocucumis palustris]|nr:rod shape-determining protein MreD [Desulfocucumis palustris]